ncbi:unnamed protein product, partial [Meganyctiphanes norvegica]
MKYKITLHKRKSGVDLDHVMYDWFKLRRVEGMPITGQILMRQATKFHQELNISINMTFSNGWLRYFLKRNGIRYPRVKGEKMSADVESAEEYIIEFEEYISENDLTKEKICNADETAILWRYIPRNTYATWNDEASGFKENKQRLTVLGCSNAAGTYKMKLAMIDVAKNSRFFPSNVIGITTKRHNF